MGKKLAAGVRLILLHPEVAYRDCGDCQKWVYNERTGERDSYRGKPIPRRAAPPPCRFQDAKGKSLCPKGTPEDGGDLNQRNRKVYEHYLECRAVGSFPDDPIVRRNAAIIRQVEESAERVWELQLAGMGLPSAPQQPRGVKHGR